MLAKSKEKIEFEKQLVAVDPELPPTEDPVAEMLWELLFKEEQGYEETIFKV